MRTPLRLLLALILAVALPTAAAAIRIVCFGDSITYGDFDDDHPYDSGAYGYPFRLNQQLPGQGWSGVTVDNYGNNGEKTASGLSRFRNTASLTSGGDIFLLMEGTNDAQGIDNGNVSIESTEYNLRQLAYNAEAAGYQVALATLIPRKRNSTADANNAITQELNSFISGLAATTGRPLIDTWDHFVSMASGSQLKDKLDDICHDYYFHGGTLCPPPKTTPWGEDPVGHPDGNGYDQLVVPFRTQVLAQLNSGADLVAMPDVSAAGPPAIYQAAVSGSPTTLHVNRYRSDIVQLEIWFGDGGHDVVDVAADMTPYDFAYMYKAPGSYTVTLRWSTAGGAQTGDVVRTVEVIDGAPVWLTSRTLVPLSFRRDGAAPDDLRFDLALHNAAAEPVLADLSLLPEPDPDGIPLPLVALTIEPPGLDPQTTIDALREAVPPPQPGPVRRYLASGQTRDLSDLLAGEFALEQLRGSLLVDWSFQTGGSAPSLSAEGALYEASQPAMGDTVGEVAESAWSSGARSFPALSPDADTRIRLSLTNLAAQDAWVTLHLKDSIASEVATATIGLLKGATTTADLETIFPGLLGYSAPLSLDVDTPSPSLSFEARAVEVDAPSGTVSVLAPAP